MEKQIKMNTMFLFGILNHKISLFMIILIQLHMIKFCTNIQIIDKAKILSLLPTSLSYETAVLPFIPSFPG